MRVPRCEMRDAGCGMRVPRCEILVPIFLKTMLNASLILPQYNPKTPPAWLSNLMDRIKPSKEDGTFAEFWQKTDELEEARVARNEKS